MASTLRLQSCSKVLKMLENLHWLNNAETAAKYGAAQA